MQVIAMGSEVDLPLQKGDAIVYQKYAMVRSPCGERNSECVGTGKALVPLRQSFPHSRAQAEVEVPDGELVFVAQKSVMGKME